MCCVTSLKGISNKGVNNFQLNANRILTDKLILTLFEDITVTTLMQAVRCNEQSYFI